MLRSPQEFFRLAVDFAPVRRLGRSNDRADFDLGRSAKGRLEFVEFGVVGQVGAARLLSRNGLEEFLHSLVHAEFEGIPSPDRQPCSPSGPRWLAWPRWRRSSASVLRRADG